MADKGLQGKRSDWRFGLLAVLAVAVMVAVNMTAGFHNYGLEGDEVFSYLSATSMGGFKGICYLEDQTWYDGDYFAQALTATGEERFNVKMVVENQAMDVHPPLYYLFLNFVCSVFPGKFSAWFGIGLNIFFMAITGIGLYLLLRYFLDNRYMALFLSTVFVCSEFAINMVLFIRMYVLLMAVVVFQSWYHLIFYDQMMAGEKEFRVKGHQRQYLMLALLTVLGALVHYYFLVFQCLIAALFVLAQWKNRRFGDSLRYMGTMAVSGAVYVCLYPAMLEHVFFKYRGREAVHKFLKEGTLFGDVIAMFRGFDRRLFRGWALPLLLLLAVVTLLLLLRRKAEGKILRKGLWLILPSLIYFFGISKASPYVSVRYVSPVAPLLFTAVAAWAKYLADCAGTEAFQPRRTYPAICLLFFLTSFFFLNKPIKEAYFTERKEVVDELAKEADYCVYMTGDEYNWKMWEDYVNYPQFQGLFFVDGRQMAPITDEKLKEQKALVLYIDRDLDPEEMYTYLKKYLPMKEYGVQYETAYTYIVLAR